MITADAAGASFVEPKCAFVYLRFVIAHAYTQLSMWVHKDVPMYHCTQHPHTALFGECSKPTKKKQIKNRKTWRKKHAELVCASLMWLLFIVWLICMYQRTILLLLLLIDVVVVVVFVRWARVGELCNTVLLLLFFFFFVLLLLLLFLLLLLLLIVLLLLLFAFYFTLLFLLHLLVISLLFVVVVFWFRIFVL